MSVPCLYQVRENTHPVRLSRGAVFELGAAMIKRILIAPVGFGMGAAVLLVAGIGPQGAAPAKAPAPASTAPIGHAAGPERLPGYNAQRNAYFGDLHVHTKLSFDAYIFNVRATPDDAYRYAKGAPLGHPGGFDVRLPTPLDFTAVTDHSEYIGALQHAANPQELIGQLPIVQGLFSSDPEQIAAAFSRIVTGYEHNNLPNEFQDPKYVAEAWKELQDAAARNNDPGRFTTFVGYEYTSAPDGRNLHRNVIFKTAKVPGLPYSALESNDPENLWRTMDGWRQRGIEALAIPHNANGSDGIMFETTKRNGQPMDQAYADLRSRNEPLTEITQTKGTSETHPSLSPNDEWANFEIMDSYIGSARPVTHFAGSYVRKALEDGILMRETKGFNPFKLGFIGSTDTHNATPGPAQERYYYGKVGKLDATPAARGSVPPGGAKTWDGHVPAPLSSAGRFQQWGASGLAGVWAEENSRDSIYAALRRKETFATSGPRMRVRFFAGYDFPDDLLQRPDTVKQAYAHGVPMGGDLLAAKGRAPKFLVWGMRDPQSGVLQRAQIVKGWVENGVAKERVFDVACSDGLQVDSRTARCPDNGATVDLVTCTTSRFKGAVELRTVWKDPEFDPKQRAFYYVRVLENPSCRWSTWDAIRNGTPPAPNIPATIMERAWSSPIWYEPRA